jgi:hypothetical protein
MLWELVCGHFDGEHLYGPPQSERERETKACRVVENKEGELEKKS